MRRGLASPFPALPLDFFRACAGLIALAYFSGELLRFADFTAPDGLLDHALAARVYWFSRLSLFQPGAPAWLLKAVLALGWTACWGLVLGVAVRPCAAAAFVAAASLFRWNLPVMEIDDAVVHLLLFWLMLLPAGTTLTLRDWRREGRGAWRRWTRLRVPGAAPRLLTANLLLIYLVAGLSKLASPLWREGLGLYAVLELPVSRTAGLWGGAPEAWLRAADYAAMALELSLPFLLLAPRGSAAKRLALLLQWAFHGIILLAFGLPVVSLALLASGLLFFAEELAGLWGSAPAAAPAAARLAPREQLAAALVVLLALAGMRGIPGLGLLEVPAQAALWLGGLCQDYHLFNWIDVTNYSVAWTLSPAPRGETPLPGPEPLFPRGARGFLLQAYLLDIPWGFVPCAERASFKRSILERAASRACRARAPGERLEASVWQQRILPPSAPAAALEGRFMMEFECGPGPARVLRTADLGAPAPDCRPGAALPALERALSR